MNRGNINPAVDGLTCLPILCDNAISKTDPSEDQFGLESKLGALLNAIQSSKTTTPFSIMITGGWGTGKTSAMCWLNAKLTGKDKGVTGEVDQVDTCWFYPWKYQNTEDVWRGLISEVIFRAIRTDGASKKNIKKAARQFGSILGNTFLETLSAIRINNGTAGIGMNSVVSGFLKGYSRTVNPHKAYYNEFEQTLRQWVEDVYPKSGKRRLVVFIDDLDRCTPDIALQVLEAIKLYLDIPNLVFVVGVDRPVIDRIIRNRYLHLATNDESNERFLARMSRYLDKIFSIEFNIEPTDLELQEFFGKRVENSSVWLAIPVSNRETLKKVILAMSGRTPRSIVRLMNRLVVAGGRCNPNSLLTFEQQIQAELIDIICLENGFEDLPQRHTEGREFFEEWYRCRRGEKVIRMPKREQEVRLRVLSTPNHLLLAPQELDNPLVTDDCKPDPKFDHLQPLLATKYAPYRGLLDNLEIARLLGIPYPCQRNTNAEQRAQMLMAVKIIVANAEGLDPEGIQDEDLTHVTKLRTSSPELIDIQPLTLLVNLRELEIDGSPVRDIGPLKELRSLKKLLLPSVKIHDISALKSLEKLEELSLAGTNVSEISVLIELKSLRSLNFEGTAVSKLDLAPFCELKKLERVTLPNGSVWRKENGRTLRQHINEFYQSPYGS